MRVMNWICVKCHWCNSMPGEYCEACGTRDASQLFPKDPTISRDRPAFTWKDVLVYAVLVAILITVVMLPALVGL